MLNSGKKTKQLKNSIFKRIQFLMTRNFFTIEEFQQLKYRKALKVIKLIAKAEGIKLSKLEAIELVEFISMNKTTKISASVVKLFSFIAEMKEQLETRVVNSIVRFIKFVFNFRVDMKQVLRV